MRQSKSKAREQMYQERMNGIQDRLDFGLQVGCQGVHIYYGGVFDCEPGEVEYNGPQQGET